MNYRTLSNGYYLGIIIMLALFFGAMIHYVPFALDDLMFRRIYMQCNGGSDSFSLRGLWNFVMSYRLVDNLRLSNTLDPVFCNMLPKWVYTLLTTVCAVGMYHIASKLVTGRSYSPLMLLGMALVSFAVFPWRDNILVPDYALNYIWPSFFLLLFFRILMISAQRHMGVSLMTAGCLTAFLAGLLHEGHGMALLAGIIIYAATKRFRMPRQWWIMVAVFVAALLWLLSAPGIQARAMREFGGSGYVNPLRLFPYVSLPFLLILVICVRMLSKGGKAWLQTKMKEPVFVVFSVGALTALVYPVVFQAFFRYGWMAQLFALIALGYIIYPLVRKLGRRISMVSLNLMCIAAAVFMINAVKVQVKYSHEYNEALGLMKLSPSGTIFYDATKKELYRRETLYMTVRCLLDWTWAVKVINRGYAPSGHMYSFVPTSLSTVSVKEAETLAGSAAAMRYGGWMIMDYDSIYKAVYPRIAGTAPDADTLSMKVAWTDLDYMFHDGRKERVHTGMYLFVNHKGDTLVFCKPQGCFDVNDLIAVDWGE